MAGAGSAYQPLNDGAASVSGCGGSMLCGKGNLPGAIFAAHKIPRAPKNDRSKNF